MPRRTKIVDLPQNEDLDTKKNRKKRKKKKLNLINLAFVVFALYAIVTFSSQYQMKDNLNKQIQEKTVEKKKLADHASELKEDAEKIKNENAKLEVVEQIARSKYRMVKPNETMYIDSNKSNNKFITGIGFTSDNTDNKNKDSESKDNKDNDND